MERFYPNFAAEFDRLLEVLGGKKAVVVGHARPDGDCIGAQAALARVLTGMGSEVVCAGLDKVPRRLEFLTPGLRFIRPDEALKLSEDWASVYVDCAGADRAGERLKARFPSPMGNIDHHLSNPRFARINLVDETSAATCEILAGMIFDKGLPVDAATAQALFAGILTDTGQFRFNATSRRSFVLAGELVARGAQPSVAGFELYERESMGKLRLLQALLASLRLECGGRVCIGELPQAVFEATGTTHEDAEGMVDYARSIDGVDVAALIERRESGVVKASLRSKDPAYRVDQIAARFNGGGHACAAGLNLRNAPEDFEKLLVEAIGRRIAEVKP